MSMSHSFWEDWSKSFNLTAFRGNLAYVSQHGTDINELTYLLTATYVELNDKLKLLEILKEDELFGATNYKFTDNINVSRDLLDSILEINFLENIFELSVLDHPKLLDIGAGYGRLAHRLVTAIPNTTVYCTDAVPESTFICEYYLDFRGVKDRAITIPLNEIKEKLPKLNIDIAMNVHSFSECTLEYIEWWLDIVRKNNIKYLFIVPHSSEFLTMETHGAPKTFYNSIISRGYKLITKEEKYYNSKLINKYGLYPNVQYYVFELIQEK